MLAHQIDDKKRTEDVAVFDNVTFESLLLSDKVLKGLTSHGFKKPSPIQLKAIPVGRCGFDLIVKSKSGTGKTLVFSIIALESLKPKQKNVAVLILSPTREIALQSQDVIKKIGCFFKDLNVDSFIGGLSITEDKAKCKQCHIAVGTPGRIKHLILDKVLNVHSVKLFVLDEADKLMEESFRNDINEIYNNLPPKKQIITTSATYPNQLEEFLTKYMLSPTHISATLDSPLLLGLKQFVILTSHHSNSVQQMKIKNDELFNILTNISFTQCLIFSNYQTRVESLSNILNQKGWPSTHISAAQTQAQRSQAVTNLKGFKCRIMLSTDLTSRGIDAANVDLVINYDIPSEPMTYLHRMGRAGRYGSSGVYINLASEGTELVRLQEILGFIGGATLAVPKLPKFVGSVSDLLSIEVPPEEYIHSQINIDFNDKLTSKIYESKPDVTTDIASNVDCNETDTCNNFETTSDRKSKITDQAETSPKKSKNIEIINILNNSNTEAEEVMKQISEIDTKTILDSLLNQNFKIESTKMETDESSINKNFDATAVLKLLSETDTLKTDSNPNIKANISEVESEQQKKEKLLIKNKALLNISKILSDSQTPEETDLIGQHLKILKAQDKSEINALSKKDMLDILNILGQKDFTNIKDEKSIDSTDLQNTYASQEMEDVGPSISKATEERTIKVETTRGYCGENDHASTSKGLDLSEPLDIDNIFEFGYKHIIKSNGDDAWKDVMKKSVETDKKKQEDAYQPVYYGDEDVNYYDTEGGYENADIMKWVPVNNSMEKSEHIVDETTEENEIMKWMPVEDTNANHNVQQTCVAEAQVDCASNEQYERYFEESSNDLWQNGLNFENVQYFDDWFNYEWEARLFAVRNYVQQRVYVSEMAKFQNSRYESTK